MNDEMKQEVDSGKSSPFKSNADSSDECQPTTDEEDEFSVLNDAVSKEALEQKYSEIPNADTSSTSEEHDIQTSPAAYGGILEMPNQPVNRYQTREAYIAALQNWVDQARMWQTVSTNYHFYYMAQSMIPPASNVQTQTVRTENVDHNRQYSMNRLPLNPNEGFEFVIPPLWKRFVAEVIDFIIMFIIKLVCIFAYMEFFGESNWGDFLEIQKNIMSRTGELSPLNNELTQAIMVLEATYRIGVFLYETTWLYNARTRFGSSTPGKSIMGLTVIISTKISNVPPNANQLRVLVYPATNLGLWNAFGRSFIKNVVLTIMFPFCFTMFLFQHNRTMYDLLFNTVVVEYNPNPPRRNWP